MHEKGRARNGWADKTHCKQGHPFTGENLRVTEQGFRKCRTCSRLNQRRYRAAASLTV
jgi:hypothetical protein